MRSLSLVGRASLCALLLVLPLRTSLAWLAPVVSLFQHTAAALALTATLLGSPAPQQPMLGKEIQSNLQLPTEDRPQIQIPSSLQQTAVKNDKNSPIVEGKR